MTDIRRISPRASLQVLFCQSNLLLKMRVESVGAVTRAHQNYHLFAFERRPHCKYPSPFPGSPSQSQSTHRSPVVVLTTVKVPQMADSISEGTLRSQDATEEGCRHYY